MVPCHFNDEGDVQWLDESHIDDSRIQFLAGFQRGGNQAAKGEEGDILAAAQNLRLAKLQRCEIDAR